MKARIQGVASQMVKFDNFLGSHLGYYYYDILIILAKQCHIAEGQDVTAMTITTLKSLHNIASFDLYWRTAATSNLEINEPTLPCHRKAPRWIDEGSTCTFHKTVKDYYILKPLILQSPVSKVVLTTQATKPMEKFKHFCLRLQLQSHMTKN